MTRMSNQAEGERGQVEDALASLAKARMLLESQITLRVQQAANRGQAALLQPALEQIVEVERALYRAQLVLGAVWRAGESSGWGDPPPARKGKKQ